MKRYELVPRRKARPNWGLYRSKEKSRLLEILERKMKSSKSSLEKEGTREEYLALKYGNAEQQAAVIIKHRKNREH